MMQNANVGQKKLLDKPDYYHYQNIEETNEIVSGINDIIQEAENLEIENFTKYVCELALKKIGVNLVLNLP